MEFIYFNLICLLTQFIKCALSEDFWISTPTILKTTSFCNWEDRQWGWVICLQSGSKLETLGPLLALGECIDCLCVSMHCSSFICQLSNRHHHAPLHDHLTWRLGRLLWFSVYLCHQIYLVISLNHLSFLSPPPLHSHHNYCNLWSFLA